MSPFARPTYRIPRLAVPVLAGTLLAACAEPTAPPAPDADLAPPSVARSHQALLPPFGETSSTGIPAQTIPGLTRGSADAIINSEIVFGRGDSDSFNGGTGGFKAWTWSGGAVPVELQEGDVVSRTEDAADFGGSALVGGTIGSNGSFAWTPGDGSRIVVAPSPNFLGGEPEVRGVGSAGTIVGWYLPGGSPIRSFYAVYSSGTGAVSGIDMGTAPFGQSPLVEDVEAGMAVGGIRDSGGVQRGFRWTQGGGFVQLMGEARAWATNGADIAGTARNPATGQFEAALLSSSAPPVFLGTLGGTTSTPTAINSSGWVVGNSVTASGQEHAFLWTPETGMIDLGTLGGATQSFANSINDAGLIAGSSNGQPVIWHYEPGSTEDQPPQIETIISQVAVEGEELVVEPIVTDPEGDLFTLEWSGQIPTGAITNGIFSWTPDAGEAGNSYEVTVTATQDDDASLSDSETFVISVVPANQAPMIETIPDQFATVGEDLIVVPAVTDPEGDPFSLEWSGDVPATAITNGIFLWRPEPGDVGSSYEITLTATQDDDASLSDSETFVISVLPAEPPPTPAGLQEELDVLRDEGVLNGGQYRALSVKVDQVVALLERNQPQEALLVLEGLEGQVRDLETDGVFTAGQAEGLLRLIQGIAEAVGG